MDFHGIPIGSVWTAVKWLPAVVLRKFFPQSRLADLQYVDLRPRHEPVTVDLGESSTFCLWLDALNLSPFDVELDRAEFEFWYGSSPLKAAILKKQAIPSGERIQLRLSGSIPDGVANQMARNYRANAGNLDGMLAGHMDFNCKLHAFPKQILSLSGIRPRVMNENFRQ
jgi:hypothetical protein